MCEEMARDPDRKANLRDPMVELIKITEGFCPVGCSQRPRGLGTRIQRPSCLNRCISNIGKLLLSTQIYDVHRLAP